MQRHDHEARMRWHIATITSKNQLTIPVEVARRVGLKPGEKVMVTLRKDGSIAIERVADGIEALAGSVSATGGRQP